MVPTVMLVVSQCLSFHTGAEWTAVLIATEDNNACIVTLEDLTVQPPNYKYALQWYCLAMNRINAVYGEQTAYTYHSATLKIAVKKNDTVSVACFPKAG